MKMMDIRSRQKFNKLPSGIRLFVPSEIFNDLKVSTFHSEKNPRRVES